MTKTEYRQYIASPDWQTRRKQFLLSLNTCSRCSLPRRLAVVAYDQDLHLHHRSYANVGAETENDLESLCARCHELETFGNSKLHIVRSFECRVCSYICFDRVDRLCDGCRVLLRAEWDNDLILMENSECDPLNLVVEDILNGLVIHTAELTSESLAPKIFMGWAKVAADKFEKRVQRGIERD